MLPKVAAILVGGLGTRLRSVVSDRPKPLADVGGRPFLTYLLDQLVWFGFSRVVLLVGFGAETVHQQFGNSYRSLTLDYSEEQELLGTAGAVRLAYEKLFPDISDHDEPPAETVLVLNGDSFCNFDFEQFWKSHRTHSAQASLVLTHAEDATRFGLVELSDNNLIQAFHEKDSRQRSGWVNAGVYLLEKSIIQEIPQGAAVSLERELFPEWGRRKALRGYRAKTAFLDIGTPDAYASAELTLSDLLPDPILHKLPGTFPLRKSA